jgi:hypothetical protein
LNTISEEQRQSLNYFVGKIVTLLVPPINRPLDDKGMLSYFLGRVTKIDNFGLWYEHLETGCKSFIFFHNLISIAEEVFVEKETEKQEKISVKKNEVPKSVEDLSNLL